MAVYEGARRGAPPLALHRGRRSAGLAGVSDGDRITLLLGGLLVAFLLGLFYLSQTLGVATTDYEIDTLLNQRIDLGRQIRSVEGDLARWGAEPAVVSGAQAIGFDRLGDPERFAAR
ncbi:MAG: hypothetical protein ACRDF7_04565 [Candidatus Limnocylindrales bacterium]